MNKPYKTMASILIIYMLIASIVLGICKNVYGINYGEVQSYNFLLIMLLIQSVFGIVLYKNYRKIIKFDSNKKYSIVMIIFIPLSILAIFSFVYNFKISLSFFIPLIIAFLAGFAEELVFRGVLFNIIKKEKGIMYAIVLSAIFFSIMHITNILGGMPLKQNLLQLVNTFFGGLFLASAYYYTKNIFIVIAYHFMWDYVPLSKITVTYPIITLIIFFLIILELIITMILLYKIRKEY